MTQGWMRIAALAPLLALIACSGSGEPGQSAEAGPYGIATQPAGPTTGAPYPYLSPDDRDAIARVTWAEAGNQGELGRTAVAFTILNRVACGRFGADVQEVVESPRQFEPVTRVGGWQYLPPLSPWRSAQFEAMLDDILSGRLTDPTGGALFFQNAQIVAARARRGRGSPELVDFGGTPPVAEIGDHRFYDWRAAINLVRLGVGTSDVWAAYVTPDEIWAASGYGAAPSTEPEVVEIAEEPATDAWEPETTTSADLSSPIVYTPADATRY